MNDGGAVPTASVTVVDLVAHAAWARRLARSLTADEDAAADLVQDTWLAANAHPPAGDRPLQPWLAVVLRNLFYRRTLSERRRRAREAQVPTAEAALTADVLVERVESQRLLADLVTGLAEPYRQTVILRFFEELSAAEIARRMSVPAGTVRWRLKTALDQLRERLDRHHDGQRARWVGVLLPLVPPGTRPSRWAWWWAAGAVTAGAALALLVVALAGSRSPSLSKPRTDVATAEAGGRGNALRSGARRPGSTPPGGVPMFAALAADDLPGCAEVARLRDESARLEIERREKLPVRTLFAQGEPNQQATEVLRPAIDRILRAAGTAEPLHALECRTWACKLSVTQTNEQLARTNDWQLPLQRDPELKERTAGMSFQSGRPSKDPLTGVGLQQNEIFIRLADPSGKRVPHPRPKPAPTPSTAPTPSSAPACAAELGQLRSAIQTARADIAKHTSPEEVFEKGPPNPALAAELRGRLLNQFPQAPADGLTVDCRAHICRTTWKGAPEQWFNQLHREPWFRRMHDGMIVGGMQGEVHFILSPVPRADGMGFLKELVARFEASRLPDDCAARFPAEGILKVRFMLPRTGEPNDQGELGRISASYGDPLAGTPLGKCLEEAIAREVLPAALPKLPVGGAVLYRRLTFPRTGGASMPSRGP